MNLTFTTTDFGEFEIKLQHPGGFAGIKQVEERLSNQITPWANVVIKEQWFDGVLILQSTIEASSASNLSVHCDNSYLLINFVLSGELTSITKQKKTIALKAGDYSCVYCRRLQIEVDIKQKVTMLSICMTRNFVKYRFGKSFMFLDHELARGEKLIYIPCKKLITEQLKTIIDEISAADQPNYVRRVFLEAKILEILSLHLSQDHISEPEPLEYTAHYIDLPKLEYAKRLLEQNITYTFSLIELARKIGLNDFKLKKEFKATYGFTVFGYLTELRMKKAQELLKGGLLVNEVATAVGYKNPQHFTSVFKKRYKVLPSKVLHYED
jgi:AraC-like DNA-binding protein